MKLNEFSVLVIVSRSHVRDKYLLFPSEILMHTHIHWRDFGQFLIFQTTADELLFNLHTLTSIYQEVYGKIYFGLIAQHKSLQ